MKKATAIMMLLAGGLSAAPRVSVGIGLGAPAPVAVAPPCPGPGYTWIDGYHAPSGVWAPGLLGPAGRGGCSAMRTRARVRASLRTFRR
jgi:hypothetical protein